MSHSENREDGMKVDNLMRKSLEEALQEHARKTGEKPEDVIIFQVTDRNNLNPNNDYIGATDRDHEKSRSQDRIKTQSKTQVMTVV